MAERPLRSVHRSIAHDSARLHVTGQARYVDDMPEPAGLLHAYVGVSGVAHGHDLGLDLDAVSEFPGVVDVFTAGDIPGRNDISPMDTGDDPILADDTVQFLGQPLFAVVAESRDAARKAASELWGAKLP